MAHLYKKVKKGHEYFYIRETQRVYGKPTTINQVYLGTADKVESALGKGGFSPKEFGSVFALNELDRDLDLAGIINGILPPKKRTKGPTLGELVFYAAMNRAISPTSKRQLASWYETTDIQRIRPLRLESLNSQNFWNHWDRISEADLDRIIRAFFQKVASLLSLQDAPLVVEATNICPTPNPANPVMEDPREADYLTAALTEERIGLAMVTEGSKGVPLYYETFPGGLPEEGFCDHLQHLLSKVSDVGVSTKDVTVLINNEMDAKFVVSRLDGQEGLRFIASRPPDFAPELMKISLKDFRPLPVKMEGRLPRGPKDDEKILYYETHAPFWNRDRHVIITFDPKTFHKSYQDLGKKVQRVRKEMAAVQQRTEHGALQEEAAAAIKAHLEQLCQRLKISADLFHLYFHQENGHFRVDCQLDHRQMANDVRHFGKNILITDRDDWSAAEIYETCIKRSVLGMQGINGRVNGNRLSGHTKDTRSPFQVALMPLYHWTDSKIRVHLFVCVVALTYLTLLCHRLAAAGISTTPREVMEELREVRTAIYLKDGDGKLRRVIEKVTETQAAILQAIGYQVEHGKVQPI